MPSIEQAHEIILANGPLMPVVQVPLKKAINRVLAEDVPAEPVPYCGSADFLGYARPGALLVLPEGVTEFPAGRVLRVPGC